MAPICLSLPLLAHIFAFHLKKKKRKIVTGKDMRSRREKIQLVVNVYSCPESEVDGLTGVEQGLTFRLDVNICDNINYISRGGGSALLPPPFFFPAPS